MATQRAKHAEPEPAADDTVEPNHQGRVKDPARDGRLKQNRDHDVSEHTTDRLVDVEQGHQGRVKDPEHDGRLEADRH